MRKREVTDRRADGAYVPFGRPNGGQRWIIFLSSGIAIYTIYLGYRKDAAGRAITYYAKKRSG